MSVKNRLINYKTYIAGQYAPATEITAQQGIFELSQASITVFPHEVWDNFGENDRVPVQLFFLDEHYVPTNPRFVQMFDGEIVGRTYTRTPNSIGETFTCVSHFEILAQMFLSLFTDIASQMVSTQDTLASQESKLGLSGLVGDKLLNNYSDEKITTKTTFEDLFTRKFLEDSKGVSTKIRRPFTLIKNILYALVNGYDSTLLRTEVSLFFKTFLCKRNIYKSIFASPILEAYSKTGDTANIILNAIKNENIVEMIMTGFSQLARTIGTNATTSYWEIFRKLFGIMMYEALNPLCPPYLKADIYGVPVSNANSLDSKKFSYEGVLNLLTKPQVFFGVPPLCNTIFPCMIQRISGNNSFMTKPSRFFLENITAFSKYGVNSGAANAVVAKYAINNTSAVYPLELMSDPKSPTSFPDIRKKLLWDVKDDYNEYFRGPITLVTNQPPSWINYVKQATLKNIKDAGEQSKSVDDLNTLGVEYEVSIKGMLNLFARNEFEKERASRDVISLETHFNPYLIAGFPAAVIDNIEYNKVFYTLPITIIHHLSTTSSSTSLSFVNTISFKKAHTTLKESPYDIGPSNPSPQVSDIFNTYKKATDYYRKLLYQSYPGKDDSKASYIFKASDFLKLLPDGSIDKTRDLKSHALFNKPGIKNEAVLPFFIDLNEALYLVSRPIATLAEFIDSRESLIYMGGESGNSVSLPSTTEKGQPNVGGLKSVGTAHYITNSILLSAETKSKSQKVQDIDKKTPSNIPVYYDQILSYTYKGQQVGTKVYFNKKPNDVENYPDFIEDWAGKVKQYREDILNIYKNFFIG